MKRSGLYLLLLAAGVVAAPCTLAQGPRRFSAQLETLDLTNCLAEPGRVPVPLSLLNPNMEIVDWTTAPSPTNQPGQFYLRFVAPVARATLLTYDAAEVFYAVSNQWKPWPAGGGGARRLQARPFPQGEPIEAIKIVVPASRQPDARPPAWRATLPFATLLPVRVQDIGSQASLTANYPSPSNQLRTLTDGVVHTGRNFQLLRPAPLRAADAWPTVTLSWDQTQSVRGLALFSGAEDRGLADCKVEACVSTRPPAEATSPWEWEPPGLVVSEPGRFRSYQFAVVQHPLLTRGLRLRATNEVGELSLGDILVFTELDRAGSSGPNLLQGRPPASGP